MKVMAGFLGLWALSLGLSLSAPMAMLILGPLVYGLPQWTLLTSPQGISCPRRREKMGSFKRSAPIFTAFFSWVALLRCFADANIGESHRYALALNPAEVFSYVAWVFCAYLLHRRQSSIMLLATGVGLPFVWALWNLPLWMAGFLLLLQNALAYSYWLRSSPSIRGKAIALASLLLFGLINAALFAGVLDPLFMALTWQRTITWTRLSPGLIGKRLLPWGDAELLWFHAVVAMAFGQTLNYFLWFQILPAKSVGFWRALSEAGRLGLGDRRKTLAMLTTLVIVVGLFRFPNLEAQGIFFVLFSYQALMETMGKISSPATI